jgi:hypothetical protein
VHVQVGRNYSHDSLVLASGTTVRLYVTPPMAIVIPNTYGLDVRLTSGSGKSTDFGDCYDDFGAYFHSGSDGVLRVSARYQTTLEYFAIPSRQECRELWVSTYSSDTVTGTAGSGSRTGTDFETKDNQDICFFHVSAVPTTITVNVATEERYDYLSWMSDDWRTSVTLTGVNSTSGNRSSCSGFYWHSDSSFVSSGLSIRWQTSSSHANNHRRWFTVDRDAFVLGDWDEDMHAGPIIAITVATLVVAVLITVIIIYCCYRRRKKQMQLQEELLDIPPVQEVDGNGVYAAPTLTVTAPGPYTPQWPRAEVFAYQAPQLVPVAGACPPVYFPAVGSPYNLSWMYPPPPAEPAQRLQQAPAGKNGPQWAGHQ